MKKLFYAGLIAMFFSGCSLFHPPSKLYTESIKEEPFDAIIVPGYPYNQHNDSVWNQVHKIRLTWASYLYKEGYTKNIIFSGGAVYTPYVESKVMGLYANELTIPSEHIYTEENAEHSVENVYYSYRVAKEHGFKNIALATDPVQTKNLRHFIRKYDLPVKLLPIMFDSIRSDLDTDLRLIHPEKAETLKSFQPLDERESLFKRLKGTFGKHIVWHKEDLKKQRFVRKFRREGRLIESK